jgi:parvulin-like peptidyl-prolyl isomerase
MTKIYKKIYFAICFILITSFLNILDAFALEYKVLSVVNGQAISNQQIKDRANILISSGVVKPDDVNEKKKLTTEVYESLVDELLQRQDAKQKSVTVAKSEIDAAIADLEKRNNLKTGGFKDFVAQKKLSYNAVVSQVESSLIWKNLLSLYVRPSIKVEEEDIKKAEKEIAKEEAKPKPEVKTYVNISEIIIPVEYGKDKEAKEMAATIARTANKGEDFVSLVKKHSAGKSADKGGLVGWLPEEALDKNLKDAIKETKVGFVSKPVKVESFYVVIKVNDRKTDEPPAQPKIPAKDRALIAKMEEGAKKYMKKLRQDAFIEKKFSDADLYSLVWGN